MAVATAIVGSAVISAYSAKKGAKSAAKATQAGADAAAQAQLESTRMQIEEMRRQFDYQMEILQPQIEQQFNAQRAYSDLLGVGDTAASTSSQIQAAQTEREIAVFQERMNAPGTTDADKQRFQVSIDELQSRQTNEPGVFRDPNLSQQRLAETETYSGTVRDNLLAGTDPGADPYRNFVQGTSLVNKGGLAADPVRQDIANRSLASGAAGTGVYGDVFKQSPGYAFQVEEMNRQLERVGSAGGPNIGGRAIMEAQRRAQGLASGEYYNWAAGRERDLTRLGGAEATDIGRLDMTAYNFQDLQQGEQARGDQAYQDYLRRREGDVARTDAAALNYDQLQATDLQRDDQQYYNYLKLLSDQAGFGGGPAATAVSAAGAQGTNVASAYRTEGTNLSNIYQTQGTNLAIIGSNKAAGYNNAIQSGLGNYFTASEAGLL